MDRLAQELLSRFETHLDEIADEIASATVTEIRSLGPVQDPALYIEVRTLARAHLDEFLRATREGGDPSGDIYTAVRERGAQRARQLVPLSALLHSYLIAQRVIADAITREAGTDARSRGAALALTAQTYDYNIGLITALADAYVEAVQGDLAELDSARRALVDGLLGGDPDAGLELARRGVGLGFDPERSHVVAIAPVDGSPRWTVQAIARAAGRSERNAFVVDRDGELLALLDADRAPAARRLLEQAAANLERSHGVRLRAGIGTAFRGVTGFAMSYHEARRAVRHTSEGRPFVLGPADVPLFDELTSSGRDGVAELIPVATREALSDADTRATLEAYIAADLNVAAAAKALSLHPNSLRYRLRRISEATGRDPRHLSDLLELIAASRVMAE